MSLVNAIINQNQYVLAPSLEMFFIDPNTGLALTSGTITFYRDVDRTPTGLKPVYRIGGTPTDPTFTALPNPITLNGVGVFVDPNNGDVILPYYNVLDDQGNVDLYYIVIKDKFGNVIETLEHFPQVTESGEDVVTNQVNYFANGQFLDHINLPDNGLITEGITTIAYGGWRFSVTLGVSTNFVTFPRYNAPTDNPLNNPRYACRVQCTLANPADTDKEILFTTKNVNFLQGQDATIGITANSNDGGTYNVNIIVSQNFGNSPSSGTIRNVVGTIVVTPQIQAFTINFTVPSTIGFTIATDDSDRFSILFQSPLAAVSDIIFTDAIFIQGTATALFYPPTTGGQENATALISCMDIPNYDNSDFGKVLTLGITEVESSAGIVFSSAPPTGTVIWYASEVVPTGYVTCNNQEYAVNSGGTVQPLSALFNTPGYGYTFGSGINGFSNNVSVTPGTATITWNRYDIAQPVPSSGTSGFTFTLVTPAVPLISPQIYTLKVNAGSLITPGSYYIQYVNTGVTFTQLMLLQVDGVGDLPNISFDVYSIIPISSSDSNVDVENKVILYANGVFQVPDLRGYSIRGWNMGAVSSSEFPHDPDANTRIATGGQTSVLRSGTGFGDNVGSFQYYGITDHAHFVSPASTVAFAFTGNSGPLAAYGLSTASVAVFANNTFTNVTGNVTSTTTGDTRGSNLYLNPLIKT